MTILYTKQGDKLRSWAIEAKGGVVTVTHGQVGGKQTSKSYTAKPTNVGRSNERDSVTQAIFEMEASVTLQLKRGYYRTQDEARAHVDFTPMLAQNSNKFKHKIVYPCYIQPKFNGNRSMVDSGVQAWSKQGEPMVLPAHWTGLDKIIEMFASLDGEVFAGTLQEGGLPLQDIVSALRKPNNDTPKLKYYVYDIPCDAPMTDRVSMLIALDIYVKKNNIQFIEVVVPSVVNSWEEIEEYTSKQIALGQEGSIVRNFKGLYEYGKRSYDLLKVKVRLDAEAEVLSYTLDKNDEPVYTVRAVNGDQTGSLFKLKMKIPDGKTIKGLNYRSRDNADSLIGQHITYEYEELSSSNCPTKPVGLCVREVLSGEGRF